MNLINFLMTLRGQMWVVSQDKEWVTNNNQKIIHEHILYSFTNKIF